MDSELYRKTRSAWEHIWLHETDLRRELATLAYPRSKEARTLYLPHLPRGELLLEAGCGMGIELVNLTRLGFHPVGIDYVRGALGQLNAAQPGHLLTAGDVHRLPYRSGAFAAYLSFGVLEHFDFGPSPALQEANRVLRPGGALILSVPYPNFVWRLNTYRRSPAKPNWEDAGQYFETAYTPDQLKRYVQQAGFEVIELHPIGHSFTLWMLGWPFRAQGYYRTSLLAQWSARWLRRFAPWRTCFANLVIARKLENALNGRRPPPGTTGL